MINSSQSRLCGNRLKQKRAAVVLYSLFPQDPRPRREAEALAAQGMEVDLLCLRGKETRPKREPGSGINIFHLPLNPLRGGQLTYLIHYFLFAFCAFIFLTLRGLVRRYDLIHVHNMPDFLVFSAVVPRLLGARVVLDMHDPMPELAMTIFGQPRNGNLVRLLVLVERMSLRYADLALTPNIAFRRAFLSRGCPSGKMQIVMNSPQTLIFDQTRVDLCRNAKSSPRQFTIMYHGCLVERHGVDLAIHAFARVRSRIPGARLTIFGGQTPYWERVSHLIKRLGIQDCIHYRGFKDLEEIALEIANCDIGIIPNRRSPFTEINMPTRIFEFLCMDRPVIVPNTKGIRDYFGPKEMIFFTPGDPEDLASRLEWAYFHSDEVADLVRRGRQVYEKHCWESEERRFVGLIDELVNGSSARSMAAIKDRLQNHAAK